MNTSQGKMDVVATLDHPLPSDKLWVRVTLKNSRVFYPSFEDLFRIVQGICHCEDVKYPHGKGREMVREFLDATVSAGKDDFPLLRERFHIPQRQCGVNAIVEAL